jgi:hypothetical protein
MSMGRWVFTEFAEGIALPICANSLLAIRTVRATRPKTENPETFIKFRPRSCRQYPELSRRSLRIGHQFTLVRGIRAKRTDEKNRRIRRKTSSLTSDNYVWHFCAATRSHVALSNLVRYSEMELLTVSS